MSDWSPGIQKVLDHVAATEGWHLSYSNNLRQDVLLRRPCPNEAHACPVTSPFQVEADAVTDYGNDDLATMGLTRDDLDSIVEAADAVRDHDPALRAALLKAARLA